MRISWMIKASMGYYIIDMEDPLFLPWLKKRGKRKTIPLLCQVDIGLMVSDQNKSNVFDRAVPVRLWQRSANGPQLWAKSAFPGRCARTDVFRAGQTAVEQPVMSFPSRCHRWPLEAVLSAGCLAAFAAIHNHSVGETRLSGGSFTSSEEGVGRGGRGGHKSNVFYL